MSISKVHCKGNDSRVIASPPAELRMNCRAGRVFWAEAISLCVLLMVSFNAYAGSSPVVSAQSPRYGIEATIDPRQKTIEASETVLFTNPTTKPLKELYFHIYPNRHFTEEEKKFIFQYGSYFKVNPFPEGFQSSQMTIKSVSLQQDRITFAIEGEDRTLLRVPLSEELSPGKSLEVRIAFSLRVPHAYGRLGYHDGIFALSRWYPILSVVDENGWNKAPFYPFHRPFYSEASIYDVSLTVPNSYVVIHSGKESFVDNSDQNTKVLKISTPLPIREFTFAMSQDYKVLESESSGVRIKSFFLPGDGNESHAQEALQDASDLMKFYTERFGPYPYEEFSIAPVYLGYGGEQMSNMIFIDTRVYQLPKILSRYLDFLIAHETGHQWFYNLIGTNEFTHMWMEEGVNSYFLLEYLEHKYGRNSSPVELPRWLSWLVPEFSFRDARDIRYKTIVRAHLDHPIVGKLSSFSEPSSIFSLTYGKGSGVVSMLRDQMGAEAFDRSFKRVFAEFQFRNLSQEDFIKICEEESGKDLQEFFRQWLMTSRYCDYAVTRTSGTHVKVANLGGIEMPVNVSVRYRDQNTEEFQWDGKGGQKEFQLERDQPIEQVSVDPQGKLLDIDRTNNVWPRKIFVKPVPLYIGLYDIPIFLPEDSYNVVVGPELANSGFGIKASLQKPYDWNFYGATDYDLGEKHQHSRVGYQLNNVFHTQTTAGVEAFNTTDFDGGEEDLAGGKVYLRRELWPAAYGLGDINDHVTLYLLRNRSLSGDLTNGGLEDSRNTSYLKKDEAIVGSVLHLGRSGPYPDPVGGYRIDTLVESSGHFLGATQYFYRGESDMSFYKSVTPQSKLAFRLKYGWGYPNDKNLYELGGMNGLRGFDRKTIRGAHAALGSVEYRFPLAQKLNLSMADHLLGLESISGVAFFDAGQAWFHDIDDTQLRKDAGMGLRFTVNLGSFLEKVLVRLDAAHPIGVSNGDTHFWFGVNHAF